MRNLTRQVLAAVERLDDEGGRRHPQSAAGILRVEPQAERAGRLGRDGERLPETMDDVTSLSLRRYNELALPARERRLSDGDF